MSDILETTSENVCVSLEGGKSDDVWNGHKLRIPAPKPIGRLWLPLQTTLCSTHKARFGHNQTIVLWPRMVRILRCLFSGSKAIYVSRFEASLEVI